MARAKTFVSASESRIIAVSQSAPMIGSFFRHTVDDERYYVPPVADVQALIDASLVSAQQYFEDVNDCDDFQRKLLVRFHIATFLDDAYRVVNGKRTRRPPYLFGEASSFEHAFNVCITSEKPNERSLRFIEPQTGTLFLPRELDEMLVELRW